MFMPSQDRKKSIKRMSLFSIALAAIFMWGMSADIQLSENNESKIMSDLIQSAHAQINNDSPISIEIGSVLPTTLNGAAFERGEAWQYAADMAVDDFNNHLTEMDADWRLALNSENSEAISTVTVDIISEMYDDGIMFIVGPALSSSVSAVSNFITENSADLVIISPASTAPDLAIMDNVYRLTVADDKQGKAIADMLYKDGKRIVIPIWADGPFGSGLAASTAANFVANGGTVDYSTNPDDGIVRSYDRCDTTYVTCIGDQFPDMAMELSSTVTEYIKTYGHDQIAIVYVGFELEEFIEEAQAYPILRTVQWMGSDASTLDAELASGDVGEFLSTVNFRSPLFSITSDTERYMNLKGMIADNYPGTESDVYVYSAYDSVWAIGLAIEAAGGLDASFDDIMGEIESAVNDNNDGALGDITLNEYGDIDAGDYAIWGIESMSWQKIGDYHADTTFKMEMDMDYEPTPVTNIGALLSLGGATGVAPTSSVFLDSDIAVTLALAEHDYNASYPNTPIKITTVDTSYGPLPALNNLDKGTYDDFYKPQLMALIENARAVYDEYGTFESLEATVPYPAPIFSFAIDRDRMLEFLDIAFEPRPPRYTDAGVPDVSVEQIFVLLSGDEQSDSWTPLPEVWTHFSAYSDNEVNNEIRALLTYHEPTDTVLGAAYYTPAGGDETHMPVLQAKIMDAIEHVEANGDVTSLTGTYDGMSPFYTFVIDTTGKILAVSLDSNDTKSAIGQSFTNNPNIPNLDKTISEINNELEADDYTWVNYTFNNPITGLYEYKRSLFMKADIDGTPYLFGSGYYPNESINQFVGPTSSANVLSVIDHVNMNDKIIISPSSTATVLAEEDNVFRLAPTNASQILPLAELMKDDGITHVVIVQRDDVWGADLATELVNEDSFKSYVTVEPLLPVDQTNFDYEASAMELESVLSTSIERADSADAVAVVYIMFDDDMISLLSAVDAILEDESPILAVNHYTTDGAANINTITDDVTAGSIAYMLNMKGITFEPARTESSISLEDRLTALGVTYNAYYASAYDSVWLLAMANESTDEHTLRAILNSGGVDEESEDVESLAVTFANNSPYPFVGALSEQGITLSAEGDLAVTSQDYGAFIIEKSEDMYSWILSPPTGTISGTIFVDNNGNGILNAGEAGISDVMVHLIDLDGQTTYATTDSDGSFMFENVTVEEYIVGAEVNDSYNYTYVTAVDDATSTANLGYR